VGAVTETVVLLPSTSVGLASEDAVDEDVIGEFDPCLFFSFAANSSEDNMAHLPLSKTGDLSSRSNVSPATTGRASRGGRIRGGIVAIGLAAEVSVADCSGHTRSKASSMALSRCEFAVAAAEARGARQATNNRKRVHGFRGLWKQCEAGDAAEENESERCMLTSGMVVAIISRVYEAVVKS